MMASSHSSSFTDAADLCGCDGRDDSGNGGGCGSGCGCGDGGGGGSGCGDGCSSGRPSFSASLGLSLSLSPASAQPQPQSLPLYLLPSLSPLSRLACLAWPAFVSFAMQHQTPWGPWE